MHSADNPDKSEKVRTEFWGRKQQVVIFAIGRFEEHYTIVTRWNHPGGKTRLAVIGWEGNRTAVPRD